jgi:DNA-binding XRE family transcriptional regulator
MELINRGGDKMETNEKKVSNNIKAMLKRYDITQEQLAERLGITRRTIINVVNHPFRYNINYLNSIASAIGCSLNDFFLII